MYIILSFADFYSSEIKVFASILGNYKGFICCSISTKNTQCSVADITQYFVGLRKRIANTTKGKFPGIPETMCLLVYFAEFQCYGIRTSVKQAIFYKRYVSVYPPRKRNLKSSAIQYLVIKHI
jgi:hypothetical protein